ncbi:DUF4328 domain-containing protein [Gordonia sp. NPDC003950]
MLDLCPRCRIQAPHRSGRDRCPRCGGPLTVVADDVEASAVVARYQQSGPPPPPPPPVRSAPHIYGTRAVRWIARRPADTLPPPRAPHQAVSHQIPRYAYIPQWGLLDAPVSPDDGPSAATRLTKALTSALHLVGLALVVSAVIHLFRYVLLAINRTTTLPEWLITFSTILVFVAGAAALGCYVYATVVFVRWLLAKRAEAYASAGYLDPRPRWMSIPLAAIPLVNVVGAPMLIYEAAAMDGRRDARDSSRLRTMWVAWALVNGVAVLAAITWWVAAESGSIQTGANAVLMVALSAAVSAVFALWVGRRLIAIFDRTHVDAAPHRRWVVAA